MIDHLFAATMAAVIALASAALLIGYREESMNTMLRKLAAVVILATVFSGCSRDTVHVYDADKDPAKAFYADSSPDPHGIAPPDPVSGIVLVPGPLVAKAIEDLTPEEAARFNPPRVR